MESFSPELSYESFNKTAIDQLRNSESAKKLRTIIAGKIKTVKKLPIEIDVKAFYEENKERYEEIIEYITDELNKIGWNAEADETTMVIDKLDQNASAATDETCCIV